MQLTSTYNVPLVSFSVFIAILASYTALELTERISLKGKIKISWLVGSSIIMGTGIWSMHFIGMLAYNIPIEITYHLKTVIVSWCPAVIASGIAFYYLHRGLNGISLLLAGTLMGSGIGAMHYIGMAAMQGPAEMHYDYFVVGLSVVFAVILSSIALATANYVKGYLEQEELKIGGSFLMGTAISGLHYIGMAAVSFTLGDETNLFVPSDLDLENASLAYTIGIVTILIIGGAFMACIKAQKQDLQIMSKKLKKSSNILKTINKELEKRVAARTTELQKAKEATEKQNIKLKRAKNAVEEAAKSKDIFLANISHELRTPLNSILGYAKILQRDSNLNQSQISDLRVVQHSGVHLLTLINDILDLSKANAAKMELYPRWIEFQTFLDGIIGIIRNSALDKGLLLKLEVQEDLAVNIKVDEKRLRQILINLLNNAVKFTFSGEVTLKISVIENIDDSSSQYNNQKLRFSVIDTGIGMNHEQLKKLFQPFEQFSNTQSQINGTGLGLSLSKQLVKLMGGTLRVKSQLGSGSNFWFDIVLPVIQVSDNLVSVTGGKILNYKGKKRKILVVDDKLSNRELLVKMLAPIGFELETANDGQEMMSKVQIMIPDLILLDLFMPGKTGFTASKEIRRIPELKHIPIIVVSATSITKDMKDYLECEAYITKPVEEEELLELLETYLQLEWIKDQDYQLEKQFKI